MAAVECGSDKTNRWRKILKIGKSGKATGKKQMRMPGYQIDHVIRLDRKYLELEFNDLSAS